PDFKLVWGYGGFIIEPIVAPMYPVHVSFPILIGGGGISYVETDWEPLTDSLQTSMQRQLKHRR
ncbi:MAG: hypothetical protein L0Y37_01125, partial [Bacteroidales bacterium]|nr:hypothetical protein [Bacteroidales bacterium]